jgi:acetyltransferase-like isoleucine patch superfamily enzyme
MMAPDVTILTLDHYYEDRSKPMLEQGVKFSNVIIEDDVWIGYGVTILPGVRIGKGSVLGARAVVTKDVKPYSVFGGIPAKIIKER